MTRLKVAKVANGPHRYPSQPGGFEAQDPHGSSEPQVISTRLLVRRHAVASKPNSGIALQFLQPVTLNHPESTS